MIIPDELKQYIKQLMKNEVTELQRENLKLKLEIKDLKTEIEILKQGGNI